MEKSCVCFSTLADLLRTEPRAECVEWGGAASARNTGATVWVSNHTVENTDLFFHTGSLTNHVNIKTVNGEQCDRVG